MVKKAKKSIAPKTIREKFKPKEDITQWCIKSHFFDEIMKLPKNIKIESVSFELGCTMKRHTLPVPLSLAKQGVNYMRESRPSFEVEGIMEFNDRDDYIKAADSICKEVNMKRETMRVRKVVISAGKSTGIFARTTKHFKDSDEKSRRMTVLGLFEWEGDQDEIGKALSAGKVRCRFEMHTSRSVFCEEL